MANANTPTATGTPKFERAELSRVVSLIRHELSELATDANRKRPFYSKSQDEAQARANAAFKALQEFAVHLDTMKKQ